MVNWVTDMCNHVYLYWLQLKTWCTELEDKNGSIHKQLGAGAGFQLGE